MSLYASNPSEIASGSLAASYAARYHLEQEQQMLSSENGETPAPPQYTFPLPIQPGQPHSTHNLTNGIVVDPMEKVNKHKRSEAVISWEMGSHSRLTCGYISSLLPPSYFLIQKLTKFANEKYLRSHPELGVLIQDFIVHVLANRPDSIEDAAIEFFVSEGEKRSQKANGSKPPTSNNP